MKHAPKHANPETSLPRGSYIASQQYRTTKARHVAERDSPLAQVTMFASKIAGLFRRSREQAAPVEMHAQAVVEPVTAASIKTDADFYTPYYPDDTYGAHLGLGIMQKYYYGRVGQPLQPSDYPYPALTTTPEAASREVVELSDGTTGASAVVTGSRASSEYFDAFSNLTDDPVPVLVDA